jgi:hypothetical protein
MFVDQRSNFLALAGWAYPSHSDRLLLSSIECHEISITRMSLCSLKKAASRSSAMSVALNMGLGFRCLHFSANLASNYACKLFAIRRVRLT